MIKIKKIISFIFLINLEPFETSLLEIRLQKMRYEYDSKVFGFINVTMPKYKSENVLHVEVEFREPIAKFDIHLDARMPRKDLSYGQIANLKINGCEALRSTRSGRKLVKIIMSSILRGGSVVPNDCPIEPYKRYVIERFNLRPEQFPILTPEMLVEANFSLYVQKHIFFSLLAVIEFVKIK